MNEFRDTTISDYNFGYMTDYDLYSLADRARRQINYDSDTFGLDQFIEDLGNIGADTYVGNLPGALVSTGVGIIHSSSAVYQLRTITDNMEGLSSEIDWELQRRKDGGFPLAGLDEVYKNYDGYEDRTIHQTGQTIEEWIHERNGSQVVGPAIYTAAQISLGSPNRGTGPGIIAPPPDTPLAFSQPGSLPTPPTDEGLFLVSGSGTPPNGLHFGPEIAPPPTQDSLPTISIVIDPVVKPLQPVPLFAPAVDLPPAIATNPLPYRITRFSELFSSGIPAPSVWDMGEEVGQPTYRTIYVPHTGPMISALAIKNYMAQYYQNRTLFDWGNKAFSGDKFLLGGVTGLVLEGGAAIGRGFDSAIAPVSKWLDNALGFDSPYRSPADGPSYWDADHVNRNDHDNDGYDDDTGLNDFGGTKADSIASGGLYPILLDLDGNGIQITSLDRSTVFRDGGDGLEHRTAWAGAGDGVLFYDPDNTGEITERRQYVFTDWDWVRENDIPLPYPDFASVYDGSVSGVNCKGNAA
ncbi:MAG TPA: hypothetical protein ENK34_11725 [Rhodobacteraceae bacterium]|nr:hypothetical protein [Paracoccaceae bacterium]